MDLRLSDRCFILTGASRGLGLATSKVLVEEGARVVILARSPDTVEAAVASLPSGRAIGLVGDIGDDATAGNAVQSALTTFGRLDGALVSTGSPAPGTPMTATDRSWREAFETVFLGGLRIARETIAGGTPGDGPNGTSTSVVMVLSTSARSPIPGLVHSNGLRPGLAMAVKDLADEVGPQGVRVNGILPGRIATDNVREHDSRQGDPDRVRLEREAGIPLRRYGEPAEFARVAAFLLSPAASYVTGSLVSVDGGLLRAL